MSISKAIKKQHVLKQYIVNADNTPIFKAVKGKDGEYRLTESPNKLQKGEEVLSDIYYDLPVFLKGSTNLVKINNGDVKFNLVNMGKLNYQNDVVAEPQININTENYMQDEKKETQYNTDAETHLVNNDALDGINKGGTKKGMILLGIVAAIFIMAVLWKGSNYKQVKA